MKKYTKYLANNVTYREALYFQIDNSFLSSKKNFNSISMNIFQMSCQMRIGFELFITKRTLELIIAYFFPSFIKWPLDVIVLTTPSCNMYAICRSSSRTFFCSVIPASPKNRVLLFLIRYKNKPIFIQKQWISFVTFDKPCYLWLNRI